VTGDYNAEKFYAGLVEHRLIIPVGVQGAFGRGAVFEDVLERFNGLVSQLSKHDNAEFYTFPPVISRKVLEKVNYLDSFPHLCGAVYSFFGKELQALALSKRVHEGEPWGDMLGITDVVLNPGDHVELGLPSRAVAGTDPHAILPGARIRPRRYAR
jgi:hypothetical protein